MSVAEIAARFPEIPEDLHDDPVFVRFAEAFGEQMLRAQKPAACAEAHDAANHYYMKLVNPIAIYRLGLMKRELLLAQLEGLLERRAADPEGFAAWLVPEGAPAGEVRGPGCA